MNRPPLPTFNYGRDTLVPRAWRQCVLEEQQPFCAVATVSLIRNHKVRLRRELDPDQRIDRLTMFAALPSMHSIRVDTPAPRRLLGIWTLT